MNKQNMHSFHIPVMGLAYTIDSPIRVAALGISSVISVMDDELIERMNEFYSKKFELTFEHIGRKVEDFRAKRITSYLNTIDVIVQKKISAVKEDLLSGRKKIEELIDFLPEASAFREELQQFVAQKTPLVKLKTLLKQYLHPGEIDVNIMTKVDRENYINSEALPTEFNDAHAALRGFAKSNLNSSVVLSAGLNPRLYSYFEEFDCFYPDANQQLAKKIILKVSDYRSALIQGSFLAKKGLWVSEYRIESGLNCGGHAFATEGYLLGPILQEFKDKKQELIATLFELVQKGLEGKGRPVLNQSLPVKITAQGGVGTAQEHDFLVQHYQVNSVGWGSPFLLVEQATSVDPHTRELLSKVQESDLYISDLSPLGVAFNTLKGTTNQEIMQQRIAQNKQGSACPRKYLALLKNHDPQGLCSASRKYQQIELAQLDKEKETLSNQQYQQKFDVITQKACLCVGLASASLLEHELPFKGQQQGVVVCPGPNMAYFDQKVSLQTMVAHIYGRANVITTTHRPNFLLKELSMYVTHFQKLVSQCDQSKLSVKRLAKFKENLLVGIDYYKDLFHSAQGPFKQQQNRLLSELEQYRSQILLA